MKKEYQRNLLKEAFFANGLGDMYGKKVPVMIKRNFIPDEYAVLEAGTLCYIDSSEEYCSQVEKDKAYFTLTLCFPANVGNEPLKCVIAKEQKEIIVSGLEENVKLSDLIGCPDESVSDKIKEYAELDEERENAEWSYENKRENIVWSCGAFAAVMIVVGLLVWGVCSLMPAGIALFALGAIAGVIAIRFAVTEYEDTKKGKALINEMNDLSLEIMSRDTELVKQYAA